MYTVPRTQNKYSSAHCTWLDRVGRTIIIIVIITICAIFHIRLNLFPAQRIAFNLCALSNRAPLELWVQIIDKIRGTSICLHTYRYTLNLVVFGMKKKTKKNCSVYVFFSVFVSVSFYILVVLLLILSYFVLFVLFSFLLGFHLFFFW